jgi:hypothetical protein
LNKLADIRKQIKSRLNLLNTLGFAFGFVSLISVFAGMGFFFSQDASSTGEDNFMSWSCRWNAIEASSVPVGMHRICRESVSTPQYSEILENND